MTMRKRTPRRHVKNNVHRCRPASTGILTATFVGCVLILVVGDNMITVVRMEQEIASLVAMFMLQNTVSFEIQTNPISI